MRSYSVLIIFLCSVFLIGCSEGKAESAVTPEKALEFIEKSDEPREYHVYDSYQVNDDLVLILFKGHMNDQDIWLAESKRENGHWKIDDVIMINNYLDKDEAHYTIHENEELGYEVGYIKGDTTEIKNEDNIKLIDLGKDEEWDVWIKSI